MAEEVVGGTRREISREGAEDSIFGKGPNDRE